MNIYSTLISAQTLTELELPITPYRGFSHRNTSISDFMETQ